MSSDDLECKFAQEEHKPMPFCLIPNESVYWGLVGYVWALCVPNYKEFRIDLKPCVELKVTKSEGTGSLETTVVIRNFKRAPYVSLTVKKPTQLFIETVNSYTVVPIVPISQYEFSNLQTQEQNNEDIEKTQDRMLEYLMKKVK